MVAATYTFDSAKVAPCPGCGTPVRQFAAVRIGGDDKYPIHAGPWWCWTCIKAGIARPARTP